LNASKGDRTIATISTLEDFKKLVQDGFDKNVESMEEEGQSTSKQLKAYLIESNFEVGEIEAPDGRWKSLDASNWYVNTAGEYPNKLFLNSGLERVWIIYSLLDAKTSDHIITKWIESKKGLDNCWLSRKHLLYWEKKESWMPRGYGFKFSDSLHPKEEAGNFSLKAWYRPNRSIIGLDNIIKSAKQNFAIHSSRWDKRTEGHLTMSAEWYSNGKVTINRANDIDETLLTISEMANKYFDSLVAATKLRDTSMGAFEINFSQEINLNAFSQKVLKGTGEMKLWLVEIESEDDFKRFKGLDLHTWDRVLLDVGPDFAYLTIPGKGCVNAAPRIATIQGENSAGRTSICHDGVEIFV
jgi:hypothetical protein